MFVDRIISLASELTDNSRLNVKILGLILVTLLTSIAYFGPMKYESADDRKPLLVNLQLLVVALFLLSWLKGSIMLADYSIC